MATNFNHLLKNWYLKQYMQENNLILIDKKYVFPNNKLLQETEFMYSTIYIEISSCSIAWILRNLINVLVILVVAVHSLVPLVVTVHGLVTLVVTIHGMVIQAAVHRS